MDKNQDFESPLENINPFPFIDKEGACGKIELVKAKFEEFEGKTPTRNEHLAVLFELARGVGHDITDEGYCLDIGTFYGMSAMVMVVGVSESRRIQKPVFTIDEYSPSRMVLEENKPYTKLNFDLEDYLHGGHQRSIRPFLCRGVAYSFGLESYLCQIIHDSVLYLQTCQIPLRLAFVDGIHDFCTPRTELDLLWKLLLPRGYIVCHDYCKPTPLVVSAVNHFITSIEPDQYTLYKYPGMIIIRRNN